MTHVFAESHGVNGTIVAASVLTLPTLRQSVSWPVLLDVPLLAFLATSIVLSDVSILYGILMLGLAPIIHERAAPWCAIYLLPILGWFWVVVGLLFAGLIYLEAYLWHQPHPDEKDVEWLAHPFRAAVAKHIPVLHDWKVWLRPWGASVLGVFWNQPQVLYAVLFGYLGVLLAQDRARIFAPACLYLCTGAAVVAGDYALAIPIINYFTHNTEV
jgi:hypothetical protein